MQNAVRAVFGPVPGFQNEFENCNGKCLLCVVLVGLALDVIDATQQQMGPGAEEATRPRRLIQIDHPGVLIQIETSFHFFNQTNIRSIITTFDDQLPQLKGICLWNAHGSTLGTGSK